MKQIVKQVLAIGAVNAMALGMVIPGIAQVKTVRTSDVVQPNPPTATEIETGQMLDKGPRRPPSAEKGIKDNGVKSCSGCGMTGRAAAPPPGGTPPPPGATDIETGQMLDKGPRWPKPTARQANGGPDGTPPPPGATDIETGQLLIKDKPVGATARTGRPKERDDDLRTNSATERRAHSGPGGTPPAAAKNQLCGVPYTPPCVTDATQRSVGTVKKGGSSALALGIGGLAAIAAIIAATSGGTPVSR